MRRRLSLIHKEPVSDQQAPLIEKRIHHANRHKCLHGEWFDLTHEEAIREVEFAVIRYADNDDVGTEKTAARASTYPNSGTIHRLSDRELSEAIFLLLCSLSERMTGQVPALVGDGYDGMPNIICAADGPVVWLDPPDPAARRESHPDK
jgi:hypothetical protein